MKEYLGIALILIATIGCRTREKEAAKQDPKLILTDSELSLDFYKGSAQAKVNIEYFADLECGACKALSPDLDIILANHPGQLKLIFKNYPKDKSCTNYDGQYLHQHSCEAAIAARCVGLKTNKFWEFKDHLFEHQSEFSDANFKTWAGEFGLNASQYESCYGTKAILDRIKSDVTEGQNRGVTGTPTIFVNGNKIFPASKELIEAEIKNHL